LPDHVAHERLLQHRAVLRKRDATPDELELAPHGPMSPHDCAPLGLLIVDGDPNAVAGLQWQPIKFA